MNADQVADVFDKPYGPLRINSAGRWWANRQTTGLDDDRKVTVVFSDGQHVAELNGTPDQLRHVAETIEAQVSSAIANTPVDRLPIGGLLHCSDRAPHDRHQWPAFGTAVTCPGRS